MIANLWHEKGQSEYMKIFKVHNKKGLPLVEIRKMYLVNGKI